MYFPAIVQKEQIERQDSQVGWFWQEFLFKAAINIALMNILPNYLFDLNSSE